MLPTPNDVANVCAQRRNQWNRLLLFFFFHLCRKSIRFEDHRDSLIRNSLWTVTNAGNRHTKQTQRCCSSRHRGNKKQTYSSDENLIWLFRIKQKQKKACSLCVVACMCKFNTTQCVVHTIVWHMRMCVCSIFICGICLFWDWLRLLFVMRQSFVSCNESFVFILISICARIYHCATYADSVECWLNGNDEFDISIYIYVGRCDVCKNDIFKLNAFFK